MSYDLNNGLAVVRGLNGADQNLGAKLRADLQNKHAVYLETVREFDNLCVNVQRGGLAMSPSDGSTAITQIAQKQRTAFEKYNTAMHAYTAFLLGGGVMAKLAADAAPVHREPRVTERELQVLKLLAAGRTTKEIARQLNIAFKTALTHRSHLLQKFDANNVALLVSKAITQGYIDL